MLKYSATITDNVGHRKFNSEQPFFLVIFQTCFSHLQENAKGIQVTWILMDLQLFGQLPEKSKQLKTYASLVHKPKTDALAVTQASLTAKLSQSDFRTNIRLTAQNNSYACFLPEYCKYCKQIFLRSNFGHRESVDIVYTIIFYGLYDTMRTKK